MRELMDISLAPDIVLYAVPMLNPDGVELSLNACPEWKANSRGVDLNENYPCLFYEKKSAPAPCGASVYPVCREYCALPLLIFLICS